LATPAKTKDSPESHRLLSLSLKWSVCYVLRRSSTNDNKLFKCKSRDTTANQQKEKGEQKLVVVRGHILRLLKQPKPLRDQLLVELPCLQAFRTGEVSSLRAEWVDLERGDIQVLDSKKFEMFTQPIISYDLVKHLDEYMKLTGISEGILIQPLPNAHHIGRKPGSKTVGAGLSTTQINRVWFKWEDICGIPKMPARMGRAYKACSMLYGFSAATGRKAPKKSIVCIMNLLRHNDIQTTEHYVSQSHLVNYEDFKAECLEGEDGKYSSFFSPLSPCQLKDTCHGFEPGCHCRMFQPQLEVEVKQQK
jgi:integrase